MVLAIGIVVDDAIVVLENVERIIATEHLSPRDATVKAMEQVTGPVIAIVFVLTAVFLPVAFLGGLVGEMFRQFALTIAVSVAISGFVALTLTPALCAALLRDEHVMEHSTFDRFNHWFARMTGRYADGVHYLMRHTALSLALVGALLVATVLLYRAVPSSLAPNEDQGYVMALPILQDAASLERTEAVSKQLNLALLNHPAIGDPLAMSGIDVMTFTLRTNTGITWVTLKDWNERKSKDLSASAVAGFVRGVGARSAMRWCSCSSRRRSKVSARPAASRPTSSRAQVATIARSNASPSSSSPRRRSARSWPTSPRRSRRACRRSTWISTASRPSCSGSRSPTCSRRCRARSGNCTSTISTAAAVSTACTSSRREVPRTPGRHPQRLRQERRQRPDSADRPRPFP
jgi:multidrug efflux pump subunit AcrB